MSDIQNFFQLEPLRQAWCEIRRKGARGGVDGVSVAAFAKDAEANLANLSRELQTNAYVPEPYERLIMKQSGGKRRPLGLPTIRDKVAQMAVRHAIEPIFNPGFANCSYAYRPNKGHRKAIGRVEHYLGQGNVWVTTCDIDKFFDSLNHATLLRAVRQKIADQRILRLIELWLKIGVVHGQTYRAMDKGIAQGGVISPLLSNIYLDAFDKHLLAQRCHLVRYADDFIVLQRSSARALAAHQSAKTFLEEQLHLRLNPLKQPTWRLNDGFVFLGLFFKGQNRAIASSKFDKARAKVIRIIDAGGGKPLSETIANLNDSIRSWRYYYQAAETAGQFAALESLLHDRLSRLLHRQLGRREVNRGQARKSLANLNFLAPKTRGEKDRFIRTLLAGKRLTPPHGAPREKQPPPQKKEPAEKQSQTGKLSPRTTLKRQIRHKKRKYQKRQAQASELVVATPYCSVGKMQQRVVVRQRGKILHQAAIMKLKHITITAKKISLSTDVIHMCGEAGIPIDFINFKGRPVARLAYPDFPRREVGLAQLRAFDNGKALSLVKTLVAAKVSNQLNLMKYFHKYHKQDDDFAKLFDQEEARIESYLTELDGLDDKAGLDTWRGKLFALEGRAASSYWRMVRELVKDDMPFEKRERQGADDLFNSLLNYGYGVLYGRIWGAVLRAGLNPAISYLHTDQPHKPTLIFDLIEEFRAQAVDRVVVSMVGRGEKLKMDGKLLSSQTRKKLLQNILERLNTPFKHRGQERSLAQIIDGQARRLASFLLGNANKYKPFIAKW